MSDPADLSIAVARRRDSDRRSIGEILSALKGETTMPGWTQAFDLRAIASYRHVESAFLHASRAMGDGRSRLKDPGVVMATYLAGTDQMEKALSRVGIAADTRKLLLVASPARDLIPLLESAGLLAWEHDLPEVPQEEAMKCLEIDPRLYASVPPTEWEYVVLEHVAMVDFKHPKATTDRDAPP